MKKIVAFLFAFIALTACSSEKVDESSIASNTDESISQIFEEKELTDSQLIHIKDSFQIDTDEISDSGFFFLYDSPINMQWINDSKAIIFTYKGNDFFEDYRCRIYIIDVKTKRLSFIKEVTFPKLPQISVYSTENFVFLFFHENNPIKLKINLETFETTEDIFSEGSHISQNGLFLLEAEGKIKIFRESDFSEPIYEFQIESYGDTAYEFASWSPNGNYVMFLLTTVSAEQPM